MAETASPQIIRLIGDQMAICQQQTGIMRNLAQMSGQRETAPVRKYLKPDGKRLTSNGNVGKI